MAAARKRDPEKKESGPSKPPARRPRGIEIEVLPAGTRLSRVYRDVFDVCDFNPTPGPVPPGGGRFDCDAAHPYGYLYAGGDDDVAVAETLLRDADPDERYRFVVRAQLAGRRLGWLAPTRDLRVVALHGTGLHAIGQSGAWLVTTDARDYGATREWGWAIRSWTKNADGFVWRAKRFTDGFAYVLFDDRCGGALRAAAHPTFSPATSIPLDGPAAASGRTYLKTVLHRFHWTLAPTET